MDKREAERILADAIGKYSDSLFRVSIAYVRNRQDAEDILQDVFLKLYERSLKKGFNDDEHLKAWLIKVTIRKSINVAKYNARHRTTQITDIYTERQTDDYSELSFLIDKLHPIDREIVYLYYYEGYPVKDISKLLRKSEASVFQALSRARKKLKGYLSEERR